MLKDSPEFQRRRIEKIASELDPSFTIEFRSNRLNPNTADIRFRIRIMKTGKIVGSITADHEWAASEVADRTDAELLQRIAALTIPVRPWSRLPTS